MTNGMQSELECLKALQLYGLEKKLIMNKTRQTKKAT
jgi:hypothetical protein